MAGPIQQIPQGLLGLLQLKQTGRLPSELLESVAPTYDLRDQYLQRGMQGEQGLFGVQPSITFAGAGHGQISFAIPAAGASVPQTETWYIETAGLLIQTLAAADIVTAGLYAQQSGGGGTMLTAQYTDITSARSRSWSTPPMPKAYWAAPGTTFFAMVFDASTAGSFIILLTMKAIRIPI